MYMKQRGHVVAWILGAPVLAFALLMLYMMVRTETPQDRAKTAARHEYQQCMEIFRDELTAPVVRSAMRGRCQDLQHAYVRTYGTQP